MRAPDEILYIARHAGVLDAGQGGGLLDLQPGLHIHTIIANATECEPCLATAATAIQEASSWLLDGLKALLKATGAQRAYIAIQREQQDAICAFQEALARHKQLSLSALDSYLPAADMGVLVYELTGKIVPEGGHPADIGIFVCDALALIQLAQALCGKPVTETWVSIAGEVKHPQVVKAPIGTTYAALLQMAGGATHAKTAWLDGGPMRGQLVHNPQQGIAKTTRGMTVLPSDHQAVSMRTRSLAQMTRQSKATCNQCMRCSDWCPRQLLGHHIDPTATMRTIDYNQAHSPHVTSAFLCSQCGICDMLACDVAQLSPRQVYAAYHKHLAHAGLKNPHHRTISEVSSTYQQTKLPMHTLLQKLDMLQYAKTLPNEGNKYVKQVRIPLHSQPHIEPIPLVKLGDFVRRGDVIAGPRPKQPGVLHHASIPGRITDISGTWIEISQP